MTYLWIALGTVAFIGLASLELLFHRHPAVGDAWRMDLDEIKRLLYMTLYMEPAQGAKRYEIAGTLINALRHHQGIDPPDLEDRVRAAVNGDHDATCYLMHQVDQRRVALARRT